MAIGCAALMAFAAELDVSKLPPPATAAVDFTRDIKPLLDSACLRCHGPERPKSRFRLDTREAALRGGAKGVAIVPGQSARSPLIHYVARLVPDLEMPPAGKGEPLTREQVALLRAWIDQGAAWPADGSEPPRVTFSASPVARWTSVSGNRQKFRELEWLREGASGGVQDFSLTQRLDADTKFSLAGRALTGQEDYQVKLTLEKADVGFARAGYEQWRRYYDDTGGYYQPITPSSFSLGRELHLDLGRAWLELGLTLPNVPRVTLGYEHQFKDGEKSTLQWGPVGTLAPLTMGTDVANIYPAAKEIRERVHILRLDVSHEVAGWELEDNFRYEFHDLRTSRDNVTAHTFGATPDTVVRFRERHEQQSAANTFLAGRQLRDWLFVSAGHLYTRVEGEASFAQQTLDGAGAPALGDAWSGGPLMLKREAHAVSASAQFGPWAGLSFSSVAQAEWTRQEGLGNVDLAFAIPGFGLIPSAATLAANLDRTSVGEHFALRYTRIPHTVLWAEGRFQQETQRQFEEQVGGAEFFSHDTDATRDVKEYRAGFHTAPFERWSFSTHLKRREKESRYDHLTDMPPPGHPYPAFLTAQDILTDQLDARLTWRAARWLRLALAGQLVATDFHTTTETAALGLDSVGASPGGTIYAGRHEAQVYSVNAVLTPVPRWYLSSTLSFSDTRTRTAQNGADYVVPFHGTVWSAQHAATFAVNDATSLQASYAFSRADYGQANEATGLPAGVDYTHHTLRAGLTRRFPKDITTGLQYLFAHYREPSGGGRNDYTAHGLFATLSVPLP